MNSWKVFPSVHEMVGNFVANLRVCEVHLDFPPFREHFPNF